MVLMVLFGLAGFYLSARLWRWYDAILHFFSPTLRIADLITWGLMLWFIIAQYQRISAMLSPMLIWRLLLYLLLWSGVTVIGFMLIGLVRLLVKRRIFR